MSLQFRHRCIAIVFLLTASIAASAGTITGRVVSVTDGDTVTVLDASEVQHKIRLAGIDAPEKRQAFGERAKIALSNVLINRDVTVEFSKMDRYGRVVGKVLLKGRDINLNQVRNGLAWHYKKYQKEQSSIDRELYSKAEDDARRRKDGLWRDAKPIAPWEFRAQKTGSNRGDLHHHVYIPSDQCRRCSLVAPASWYGDRRQVKPAMTSTKSHTKALAPSCYGMYCTVHYGGGRQTQKSATLTMRVSPGVKDILIQASKAEGRSQTNLAEKLIKDHCASAEGDRAGELRSTTSSE